ncbi:hypothetical protein [Nonomuraea sp. NPDC048916]|uniref:hypothetical protein n=1 Tax=Nonomuraea sp. NPDC048916 TaxID=3154232 RepID=UPI0033D7AC12
MGRLVGRLVGRPCGPVWLDPGVVSVVPAVEVSRAALLVLVLVPMLGVPGVRVPRVRTPGVLGV